MLPRGYYLLNIVALWTEKVDGHCPQDQGAHYYHVLVKREKNRQKLNRKDALCGHVLVYSGKNNGDSYLT